MKREKLLELVKNNVELPEGVDAKDLKINIDPIHENVNSFANDLVKSESEKSRSKAQQEMLESYGFESQEQLDEAIKKANNPDDEEKLTELSNKVEKLESDLQEKEKVLKQAQNKEVLKSLNVRDDRIEKALKLIGEDEDEETSFEEKAKEFVNETPEWLAEEKKEPKNLGGDGDPEKGKTDEDVEAFRKGFMGEN